MFGWKKKSRDQAGTKVPPSLIEALVTLSDIETMEAVVLHSSDARELLDNAAKALKTASEELGERVSSLIGIPYQREYSSFSVQHLPSEVTLSELRRFGVLPVFDGQGITGFTIADPTFLRTIEIAPSSIKISTAFHRLLTTHPLFLGSWQLIAHALGESEDNYLVKRAEEEVFKANKKDELAGEVLLFILEQAVTHGAKSLSIYDETPSRYEFVLPDGRTGKGEIESDLIPALLALLDSGSAIKLPEACGGEVSPEWHREGSEIRIVWAQPLLETPLPEETNEDSVGESAADTETEETHVRAPREHVSAPVVEAIKNDEELLRGPSEEDLQKIQAELEAPVQGTVLLIDDNPTFLRVMERFLTRHEIETKTASDATEALHLLKETKNPPALVVCDVHMPRMSGVEFVRSLRLLAPYHSTPVIMFSSDEESETKIDAYETGADVYLKKHEDPRVFCAQVKRLLRKSKRAQ